MCSHHIMFSKKFLYRVILTSKKKFIFKEKTKKDLYLENDIFQKVWESPYNIVCMLNILQINSEYNIATYGLHVYKTFTKYSHLVCSWAPHKILILRIDHCQCWKCDPLILLCYK